MNFWKFSFFILFFSIFQFGKTQLIPDSFIKTTDSIINAGPKTYADLDALLRPSRKDTTLMRYFSQEASKNNFHVGEAYALNQLGRRYRDLSQFTTALNLHRKALDAANASDNLEFQVYSLNMISVVFRKTDAIKSSLDYSQEALELAETVKNPSRGLKRSINVSLNNIGNIYRILEQYDLAIQQFEKSLKLEEELGNKLGLAINHQNIGECYEALDQLEESLQSYQTSLAYNNEIDSDRGRVICKASIAYIYAHQDKPKEGLEIIESIIGLSEDLGDKNIISNVQTNLGWILMDLKRYKEAEVHLLKGLEIAQKFNFPSQLSETNKFLSELYGKQGDYKKSLEYYQIAKGYEKEISNDRNRRYVSDMIMRYETEKRSKQFEVLARENEMVKLKLRKNQTSLLIGGFTLALLAGIFYILYRQYQLKNDKKLLTLEQTMLRSQMNPHFLFNSLNSIKLYIINNEKKNAVHYLNKFSKLVRKILEASSLKEISLADELETVELYMNIENIRFSDEINFNISIDDNIDIHTVKIPSLILQPFLENALWHGLSTIEGEKNIDLHISNGNGKFIDISIIDNGIGRAASEIIKKSKVLKRKSVGIEITKERLANFSKDYQNSFDVSIVDLYDTENSPIGTQIILHIPTI